VLAALDAESTRTTDGAPAERVLGTESIVRDEGMASGYYLANLEESRALFASIERKLVDYLVDCQIIIGVEDLHRQG
jgi:hypothetical protein